MPEPRKPLVMGAGPSLPLPTGRDVVSAFTALTPLPWPRPGVHSEAFARATLFFPLVGLTVGVALTVVQRGLAPLCPDWLIVVAVVAGWTVITLPTTEFSRSISARLGAIVLSFVAKSALLLSLSNGRGLALLFAPLLGRWSLVVLAIGARSAGAAGRKFNPAISFREFGWTSVLTGAVLAACADAVGILIFVGAAALALVMRLFCHRVLGGVSWRVLCACVHTVETLLLAAFLAF